jgi:hypothetical protein
MLISNLIEWFEKGKAAQVQMKPTFRTKLCGRHFGLSRWYHPFSHAALAT